MSWSCRTSKISSRQSLITLPSLSVGPSAHPRALNLPRTRVQHDPVSRKGEPRVLAALELKFAVRYGIERNRPGLVEIEHRPRPDRLDREPARLDPDLE